MTRSVRPWCLKRRTSLIRRIDNLSVGIRLPHWLNEKSVARLSCRPKRLAPPKRCSRSPEIAAHDPLKSLLTIPRNTCSRCSEIRAHDPAKRAISAPQRQTQSFSISQKDLDAALMKDQHQTIMMH